MEDEQHNEHQKLHQNAHQQRPSNAQLVSVMEREEDGHQLTGANDDHAVPVLRDTQSNCQQHRQHHIHKHH